MHERDASQCTYFQDTVMADGHVLHLGTLKPISLDLLKQFTELGIVVIRVSHKFAGPWRAQGSESVSEIKQENTNG